jgi:hypothetical protein
MRNCWRELLAIVIVALGTNLVQAQPPGGYAPPPPPGGINMRPPAFSPYLNLLRGGSPAVNYYGLVRPEMQFRQAIQNLSADVAMNQQMIGGLGSELGAIQSTGHPTQFMNLGGYFMNSSGASGASILGAGSSRYGGGTMNLTRPAATQSPRR